MTLLPQPRQVDLGPLVTLAGMSVIEQDATLPPEGYRLEIAATGEVTIAAADDAGAFYGQATLAQLTVDGRAPQGTVEDFPDLPVRGVMLDISRDKVPTMETLHALVDRLASWKINQIQLYCEHTFAYTDHATVWEKASPVTAEEIRELDEHCRHVHIELVPNQNCLGHWDRWLKHDRYRPLALRPDGWTERGRHRAPTTIDPNKPESLELIRTLLAELLPNFTSERVHVGLDEPWELPRSQIEDYLAWVEKLRAVPELAGRQMLLWGDILAADPDLLARLPKDDVTICEWFYDVGWQWAARGAAYEKAGVDWWACPGTSSWQTVLGRWDNAVANIAESVDAALAHGASGMLLTDWGDRGHLQYLPISEPGFAWGAAQAWCRATNASLDLVAALDEHCYSDDARVLGGVLHDLGNAYLAITPQFFNLATLVLQLYFPQLQQGRGMTEGIDQAQIHRARSILTSCRSRLGSARPARADGALVIEELHAGIALVLLLCDDMEARLQTDGWLASVPAATRVALADRLVPVIAEHRRLWLARNRPGGLDDSARWLENLEHCWRTGETEKHWGGW